MSNKKPTSIPQHRKHEAHQHNIAPRLEGAVKNAGIKPMRKSKKRKFSTEAQREAEKFAHEQLEAWEET